jgi:hypothetical protein
MPRPRPGGASVSPNAVEMRPSARSRRLTGLNRRTRPKGLDTPEMPPSVPWTRRTTRPGAARRAFPARAGQDTVRATQDADTPVPPGRRCHQRQAVTTPTEPVRRAGGQWSSAWVVPQGTAAAKHQARVHEGSGAGFARVHEGSGAVPRPVERGRGGERGGRRLAGPDFAGPDRRGDQRAAVTWMREVGTPRMAGRRRRGGRTSRCRDMTDASPASGQGIPTSTDVGNEQLYWLQPPNPRHTAFVGPTPPAVGEWVGGEAPPGRRAGGQRGFETGPG